MNHLKFRKAWELVVLMLFAVSANASTTILSFDLSEFLANPTTNRQLVLQPMSPFPGNMVYIYSDTNGMAYLTNPVATLYNGYIAAPPAKTTFQLWVTSTNLGLVDAYSLLATGSASTYPAGQVAWSIATSDARYQLSGSASSNAFYPLSNPSNYATLTQVTNIALRANTNVYVPGTLMSATTNGGTITFNAAQQTNSSFASTNYVNTATNNLLATITNIAAGQVGAANFQPSSANLTNYATLSTNSFVPFVTLVTLQPANATLTNLTQLTTNAFYDTANRSNFITKAEATNVALNIAITATNGLASTNYVIAATNGLASTNYVNNATNNLLATITNIASQFSSTASNAIAANNGFGTNTTILNGVSLRATNLYGGQIVVTNNTIGSTNNSGVNVSVNGNPVFQIGQNANVNGHFLVGNLSNMVGDGIFGDNPDNSNKDRGVGIIGGNWNHNTDLSGGNMFYQYIVGGVSNNIYSGNRGSNVMIIGGANVSLTTFGSTGSGSIDNSSVIFSRDSAVTNVNQNGNVSGNNVIFSRNSTIYSGNNFSNNVIFSANNIVITNAKNSLGLGTGILISNDNVVAISGSTNGTINSTTNSQMLLAFTNGVAINTNSAGTNGLRVAGNVDSSVGFTVNGVPVASAVNAQPANANLTNYSLLPTNSFISAASLASIQPASAALTNYGALGTNAFYATSNPSNFITKAESTNLVIAATNGLYSASNPSNFVVSAETNVFVNITGGRSTNQYVNSPLLGGVASGTLTFSGTNKQTQLSTNNLIINPTTLATGDASLGTVGSVVEGWDIQVYDDRPQYQNERYTLIQPTNVTIYKRVGTSTNFIIAGISNRPYIVLNQGGTNYQTGEGIFLQHPVDGTTNWLSSLKGLFVGGAQIRGQILANSELISNALSFGYLTNLQVTTNIVGVVGGGSAAANGTFVWNGSVYSNATTTATINFQNPTWFITTNGVNLYSASSPNGPWSLVSGLSSVPTGDYGVYFKQEGIVYTGVINSTNLTYQITNAIATGAFGVSTKVGFTNIPVYTTNFGFHVSSTPISTINNNYFLSFTNAGIANAGYAVWANEADSRFTIVFNDLSNPGYSLESNLVSIYYYAADPLSTWTENDGPTPVPVVTATNKITTNWVTSFSITNPPAADSVFPAVAANNTVWVDPNATGTGLRGRQDHPFKDIHDAQLASRAGDMFVLLPGVHQLSFDFTPTNAVIDARGAVINYTTNNGVVNNNPSFFPVGSCTVYGGTWSNAYWSGGSTLGFANVTNFIAYHSRFYAYAFIGSDTSISSNCVAEMNGCFFRGSDYQSFILSGQNTNTYFKWLNCTFQPSSLPGGFFNDYGPSPARQVLSLSKMRADVVNCLFDWSYTTNTLSAASASNSWCVLADTNSFVFVNNNSFILSPYKGTNNINTVGTYWQTNGGVILQQASAAASLPAILTTNQVYASNVISGGVLPDGTIAATVTNNSSGSYFYIRDAAGIRWRTQDAGGASGLTNLGAANIAGTVPQYPTVQVAANVPSANLVMATDGNTNRVWTNAIPSGVTMAGSQLTGTIPLGTLPAGVLTNNAASSVTLLGGLTESGAVLVTNNTSSGIIVVNPAGAFNVVIKTNQPLLVTNYSGTTLFAVDTSGNQTNNFVKASSSGFAAGTATWSQSSLSFADWSASFGWSSGSAWGHDNSAGNPRVVFGSGKPNLIEIGGATASFPALFRTNATLVLVGGDGVASSTNNLIIPGTMTATNGLASYKNNLQTNTVIAVGSSPFNWTNTTGVNVFVDIDANGATTAVQRNGQNIFGTLASGDHEVYVKPNGYLTITYSVATPIMGYTEQ